MFPSIRRLPEKMSLRLHANTSGSEGKCLHVNKKQPMPSMHLADINCSKRIHMNLTDFMDTTLQIVLLHTFLCSTFITVESRL